MAGLPELRRGGGGAAVGLFSYNSPCACQSLPSSSSPASVSPRTVAFVRRFSVSKTSIQGAPQSGWNGSRRRCYRLMRLVVVGVGANLDSFNGGKESEAVRKPSARSRSDFFFPFFFEAIWLVGESNCQCVCRESGGIMEGKRCQMRRIRARFSSNSCCGNNSATSLRTAWCLV